ncbi:MAG: long-chain fatty acid--CoA ligase [Acidimicrobiales bacterium]|nr:long-chain fatty acid--CoA ligase [Acidimicrobiales bacterium]
MAGTVAASRFRRVLYGLNMDRPLLLGGLLEYAARYHADTDVVSVDSAGERRRLGYDEVYDRSRRVSTVLAGLGVQRGDRVATLAWNDHRHLCAYYGIVGIGAVLHTINPRLFDDQLAFIIGHAEDRVVLYDPAFAEQVERLRPLAPHVEHWLALDPAFDALVDAARPDTDWPELDEREAACLCYTSGTTGNPKGILYHHRALVLQSLTLCTNEGHGVTSSESVLVVPPMFHVNGWALPFACPLSGARLLLPGPDLSPEALVRWINDEGATVTAGVPTVWLALVSHLQQHGLRIDPLQRIAIGGSSAPPALIATLEDDYGVRVSHVWGMTEMTLGVSGALTGRVKAMPVEQRRLRQMKAGRAVYGVELEIVDEAGNPLPHDGVAQGELLARGPWVAGSYYRNDTGGGTAHTADGWLRTGDIATMDREGYIELVDRAKDVIKSGGEWISSIILENAAVGCPGVAEAAVIGVPHPRWQERPLLVVVRRPGSDVTAEQITAHLSTQVAKWWLPDEIRFVDELPHTGTGKIAKNVLRSRMG